MRAGFCCVAALVVTLALPRASRADSYRLRADSFAAAADSPVGLVALQAETREGTWFDAEAMVWVGAGQVGTSGDAMIAAIRARDPEGRGEARFGRMLFSSGAIRPVHFDGISLVARAPWGGALEAFGGLPVSPGLEARRYDWVVGERMSQTIGQIGKGGVSYIQRRDDGRLAFAELGADLGIWPARWFDAGSTVAVDLLGWGITEARVSTTFRLDDSRAELFAARRSPSRLLPATSLFAALGDIPSDRLGASLFYRVAPRLDLSATGSVQSLGGDLGGDQSLRATLRTDDEGASAISIEARRQGAPDASWTGFSTRLRLRLPERFVFGVELEVVLPDDPRDRGSYYPWSLVSLGYLPDSFWEAAAAVEASASPESVASLSGLFRLSATWEKR